MQHRKCAFDENVDLLKIINNASKLNAIESMHITINDDSIEFPSNLEAGNRMHHFSIFSKRDLFISLSWPFHRN